MKDLKLLSPAAAADSALEVTLPLMLVPITYLSLKAAASVTLFLALSRPSVMYILTWSKRQLKTALT
nr:hypothetical protein Iba_scaffold355199CG0010 [Ipomoea batatas]